MKKKYLILIISIVILMCSCAKEDEKADDEAQKTYKVLEVGGYLDSDDGVHCDEYELWSAKNIYGYKKDDVPEYMQVTVNGVTYGGQYERSHSAVSKDFMMDIYEGDGYEFGINEETGEFVKLFAWKHDSVYEISVEERMALANSIASDYIDLDSYEIEVDDSSTYSTIFSYFKEIDGHRISDAVYIAMTKPGDIISISLNIHEDVENIVGKSNLFDIDSEEIDEMLVEKIKTIYPGYESYEVQYVKNVIIEDKVAILYSVVVYYDFSKSSWIDLLIME